jgi:hypothetical protein
MRFSSNYKEFASGLKKEVLIVQKMLAERIVNTARFAHRSLIDKTPVWEGKTVRNYIMTVGSPFAGEFDEIGTGPTGVTSQMALGSEPRRAANAEAALATGSVLTLKNAFSQIYISNNTDTVAGLENGDLPGDGKPSRSPQGMFAITAQEVMQRLKSGRL